MNNRKDKCSICECDFDEESEGGEKGRRVGRLEVTDKDIQLVILHALLSAGWNPDGALIESVRLVKDWEIILKGNAEAKA